MSVPAALSLMELPTSRGDRLDRIAEAGLVAEGRVFLLSLEPVRAQLGARWPAREDVVWDAIEKALVKRMPPPDVFLRLNPTTVLAAIASTDRYEGQVLCAEVLRSILTFFLGRSVDDDLGISRVSSLGREGLTAERVDLAAPRPKSVDAPAQSLSGQGSTAVGLSTVGRRESSNFQSDHHGIVSVSQDIVPVWRLDQGVIGAHALRQTLSVRADLLSDSDHEKIVMAATAAVVPILERFRDLGSAFALILPCAFGVISARRPRLALLERCAGVNDIMRSVVVLEMEGIHAGVPAGLVRETVAMIKPFVRTLTVLVKDGPDTQTAFREAAFHGLTVNGSTLPRNQLETVIRSGRRRTPNILVRDAPATLDPDWLRACGASHVSWISPADQPLPPRTT